MNKLLHSKASHYLRRLLIVIVCLFAYACQTKNVQNPPTNTPISHAYAWQSTIARADRDPYARYGIYASRTLSVVHPEIYLRADILFLLSVNNRNLFALLKEDASDFQFTPIHFSLDDIEPTRYQLISSLKSYPDSIRFMPFVDRRMLSPAARLRRVHEGELVDQVHIQQIELA